MKPDVEDLEDALFNFKAFINFPLVSKASYEKDLLEVLDTFRADLEAQYLDHCKQIEERDI